jgi:hypothetical protein
MSMRDSARLAALEARIAQLAARIEVLEAPRRAHDRGQNSDRVVSTKKAKGHH